MRCQRLQVENTTMKLHVLLAVTCLVAVEARRPGFPHPPHDSECLDVLMPPEQRENLTAIIKTCIAELDLTVPGPLRHENFPKPPLELRVCVADAMDLVTDAGTFDGEALIESIEESAEGTPQEDNINLGLDSCSTDGFADFDTQGFITCVLAYCETGEAPSPPSPPFFPPPPPPPEFPAL